MLNNKIYFSSAHSHWGCEEPHHSSRHGSVPPPIVSNGVTSQVNTVSNSLTAEQALMSEVGKKMNTLCNDQDVTQRDNQSCDGMQDRDKSQHEEKELASQLKFGNEIKILLIPGVDLRIMCHFLGLQNVNEVKSANFVNVPLVSLLLMETMVDYMRTKGYSIAGECLFDDNGYPVPVTKHTWQINKKEISFTRRGYIYFEKMSGERHENVVMFVASCLEDHRAGITCFSENEINSKKLLSGLDEYAKSHNCLRGENLRNVNVLNASFEEATGYENVTWDNFYYEDNIRDVIELQIFGFLNNIEKHNNKGIFKRGVLMHGIPGTGKTSLGKIICNYGKGITVIWITPDLISENGQNSVKLLYMLSDYLSPGVVILEDMDLFSSDRETGLVNSLRLGTLMNILDGIYTIKNMVTLATTNRMEIVEQALRNRPGRFDRIVEVPALKTDLRERMFNDKMHEFTLDDGIMESLVEQTDKWTGAEIQELINSFHMHFIQEDEEENLHITSKLSKDIFDSMAKFSLKEGHRKKPLGFGSVKPDSD